MDRRFCDKNAQNHNKAWHTQHSAKFASSGKKERRLRNHVFKRLTSHQSLQRSRRKQRTANACSDIKARGVMLDISRTKVPTMDTLLTLIDQFSTLKYNQIQLYTEHTFAFSNHRQVWQDASPYTASDIINIRQYCEDRFIDLVPNLNSFGHFERWLRHPTYHHLAECPDGFIHPFWRQTYLFRQHPQT